ncbi:hypothetical protein CEXT_243681 [Caerostris extrusa]|uniref:Uncharacterized protein n=1 Tax=Caerostris extrusa TaxID=172846 RepID=A0AAV4RVB3_CAEEX|nr:hypothetical protein CEXT_243681 [Caerostris extrusa]
MFVYIQADLDESSSPQLMLVDKQAPPTFVRLFSSIRRQRPLPDRAAGRLSTGRNYVRETLMRDPQSTSAGATSKSWFRMH